MCSNVAVLLLKYKNAQMDYIFASNNISKELLKSCLQGADITLKSLCGFFLCLFGKRLHPLNLIPDMKSVDEAVIPTTLLHNTTSTASASSTTTENASRGRYFLSVASSFLMIVTIQGSWLLSVRLQITGRIGEIPHLIWSINTKRLHTDCSGRKHSWNEHLQLCCQVTAQND